MKMFWNFRSLKMGRYLLALAMSLTLAACGHDDDHDHGDDHGDQTTAVEEACEHAQGGPFEVVTAAAADADEVTVDVSEEHTAYVVTLVEADDQYSGAVSFTADEAGEFAIFTSAHVAVTVLAEDGTEVEIEASSQVDECVEVAHQYVVDLEASTYTVVIGPTDAQEVTIVIEHLADAHEGHDH